MLTLFVQALIKKIEFFGMVQNHVKKGNKRHKGIVLLFDHLNLISVQASGSSLEPVKA